MCVYIYMIIYSIVYISLLLDTGFPKEVYMICFILFFRYTGNKSKNIYLKKINHNNLKSKN